MKRFFPLCVVVGACTEIFDEEGPEISEQVFVDDFISLIWTVEGVKLELLKTIAGLLFKDLCSA